MYNNLVSKDDFYMNFSDLIYFETQTHFLQCERGLTLMALGWVECRMNVASGLSEVDGLSGSGVLSHHGLAYIWACDSTHVERALYHYSTQLLLCREYVYHIKKGTLCVCVYWCEASFIWASSSYIFLTVRYGNKTSRTA